MRRAWIAILIRSRRWFGHAWTFSSSSTRIGSCSSVMLITVCFFLFLWFWFWFFCSFGFGFVLCWCLSFFPSLWKRKILMAFHMSLTMLVFANSRSAEPKPHRPWWHVPISLSAVMVTCRARCESWPSTAASLRWNRPLLDCVKMVSSYSFALLGNSRVFFNLFFN